MTVLFKVKFFQSDPTIEEDEKSSPLISQSRVQQAPPQPVAPAESDADDSFDVDNVVSMVLLGAEAAGNQAAGGAAAHAVDPLAALVGPGGFAQLLEMQQPEDDEAMVELAIALSLQEHEAGGGAGAAAPIQVLQQGLANLQGLEGLQNFGQSLQALAQVAQQGLDQVQNAVQVSQIAILIGRKNFIEILFFT